jgi:hypothetical protein
LNFFLIFQAKNIMPGVDELTTDIKVEPVLMINDVTIPVETVIKVDESEQKPSKKRMQSETPIEVDLKCLKTEYTSEWPAEIEIVDDILVDEVNDPLGTSSEENTLHLNNEVQCYYCSEMMPLHEAKDHQVVCHFSKN